MALHKFKESRGTTVGFVEARLTHSSCPSMAGVWADMGLQLPSKAMMSFAGTAF